MDSTTPGAALMVSSRSPDRLFEAAAALARERSNALLVSSSTALHDCRALRGSGVRSTLIADPALWRTHSISSDATTSLDLDGTMLPLSINDWAQAMVADSYADWVLTPSFGVTKSDPTALSRLLAATDSATHPQLLTHLAVPADVLSLANIDQFMGTLVASRARQFAFTFHSATSAFGTGERLAGLAVLLAAYPGSHVYGVEPLVAAFALAHGAGLVGVGLTRSHRRPRPPEPRTGGVARARGWLPGLFLESLLELRSPDVYADWLADQDPQWCDRCQMRLDLFDATAEDKAAIGKHNVHAIDDFLSWLLLHAPHARARALSHCAIDAAAAHVAITGSVPGTSVVIDATLAAICELADV